MSSKRYPDEFKIEAVRQVVERGHSVAEVASRLGMTTHSLYAYIRANSVTWPVRRLCDLLDIHPSGYYPWRKQPWSAREKENQRLTGLIKQFWLESGGVYGYRKIHTDVRDVGECCSENCVYRLMQASLSRRGNCHDNAVAESFFQLLKRERIKRHIYATRDDARADVVDYIEMFYNSKRRHRFNDLLSPVEYEKKFTERLVSV